MRLMSTLQVRETWRNSNAACGHWKNVPSRGKASVIKGLKVVPQRRLQSSCNEVGHAFARSAQSQGKRAYT